MGALIALAAFVLICLLLGLASADSRPGFDGRRQDRKDRWFYHSKTD
jgi:hypothetical protein